MTETTSDMSRGCTAQTFAAHGSDLELRVLWWVSGVPQASDAVVQTIVDFIATRDHSARHSF